LRNLCCAVCIRPQGAFKRQGSNLLSGFEDALEGVRLSDNYVAVDGNFITARGAGVSVEFGLAIVAKLKGEDEAQRVKTQIQCNEK
jgi:4-methyl-5(b-hydroxyethyl)-thiazole monophosphate biosynthesis